MSFEFLLAISFWMESQDKQSTVLGLAQAGGPNIHKCQSQGISLFLVMDIKHHPRSSALFPLSAGVEDCGANHEESQYGVMEGLQT